MSASPSHPETRAHTHTHTAQRENYVKDIKFTAYLRYMCVNMCFSATTASVSSDSYALCLQMQSAHTLYTHTHTHTHTHTYTHTHTHTHTQTYTYCTHSHYVCSGAQLIPPRAIMSHSRLQKTGSESSDDCLCVVYLSKRWL